jgi:hypothetical protein
MSTIHDRVRKRTAAHVLRRIDDLSIDRLTRLAEAGSPAITYQVERLEREWDTDRSIEAEAAITGLVGLAMSVLVDRRFIAVPAIAGAAVFAHALSGWYPLLPVMRRLGIRSAREIARERYALKALRGDFAGMESESTDMLHGTARQDARVEGQS